MELNAHKIKGDMFSGFYNFQFRSTQYKNFFESGLKLRCQTMLEGIAGDILN